LNFDFEFLILFGAWDLDFGICLVLGAWNLEFKPVTRHPETHIPALFSVGYPFL
jgi:hypothetical protein